jgi:hypothetical protein
MDREVGSQDDETDRSAPRWGRHQDSASGRVPFKNHFAEDTLGRDRETAVHRRNRLQRLAVNSR